MNIFIDTQLWAYAFKRLMKVSLRVEKNSKKQLKCIEELIGLSMNP